MSLWRENGPDPSRKSMTVFARRGVLNELRSRIAATFVAVHARISVLLGRRPRAPRCSASQSADSTAFLFSAQRFNQDRPNEPCSTRKKPSWTTMWKPPGAIYTLPCSIAVSTS